MLHYAQASCSKNSGRGNDKQTFETQQKKNSVKMNFLSNDALMKATGTTGILCYHHLLRQCTNNRAVKRLILIALIAVINFLKSRINCILTHVVSIGTPCDRLCENDRTD